MSPPRISLRVIFCCRDSSSDARALIDSRVFLISFSSDILISSSVIFLFSYSQFCTSATWVALQLIITRSDNFIIDQSKWAVHIAKEVFLCLSFGIPSLHDVLYNSIFQRLISNNYQTSFFVHHFYGCV